MLKITLVENELGDWEGLYIDEDLVVEAHKLSSKDILKALECRNIRFKNIELTEGQMEELSYSLPKYLLDIEAKL